MILCGGDALIDFVPVIEPDGGTGFVPRVGGAILNAATALRRLGEDVSFVGALSSDMFGDLLHQHMQNEGIETDHVERTDDDSTLAFVTLEKGDPKYAFYDRASAGRLWRGPGPLLSADALHLGSLTLIGDPAASAYTSMAERLADEMVISLDPNCRPALVSDVPVYRARVRRVATVSHIIRLSEADLAFVFPDIEESGVVSKLLNGLTKLVIVSRGSNGASAYWSGGHLDVPAKSVAVCDSIGAGDTFHAGVLASLSREGFLSQSGLDKLDEKTMSRCLELASTAAALNCQENGCNPPRLDAVLAAI